MILHKILSMSVTVSPSFLFYWVVTLTQRPRSDLLCLVVVGPVPHLLQLVVIPVMYCNVMNVMQIYILLLLYLLSNSLVSRIVYSSFTEVIRGDNEKIEMMLLP